MKGHVVVTVYTGKGVPTIHAYGPYTKVQANNERRKMRRDYSDEVSAGTLLVSACKTIDIDAMNARLPQS